MNSVSAVELTNLYAASVPVASRQTSDRDRAFNEGLKVVLVKVSGQYQQMMQPEMLAAWLPAQPYVQTFGYRENPAYQKYQQLERQKAAIKTGDSAGAVSPDEATPLPYLLDVSFAPSVIQEKLAALGIAEWGSSRPAVLLWMVLEQNGERSLVGTSDDQGLVEPLLNAAELRGVPLFLPVADLEDVSAVKVNDLWNLDSASVSSASERYRADAVALIRVDQIDAARWEGHWVIDQKQQLKRGSLTGVSLQHLSLALITDISETLSARYAVLKGSSSATRTQNQSDDQGGQPNDRQTLDLVVSQINTFDDFIALQNYLKALPPVSDAALQWVGQGRAAYHLVLVGSKQKFIEHLELGRQLRPDLAVSETAGAVDYFIWSTAKP